MTAMGQTLAIALLLLATAARGDSRADFEAGQAAYNEGEVEVALGHFDRAAQSSTDRAELGRIHLFRAKCHRLLKQAGTSDAIAIDKALNAALEADPDARLNPDRDPEDLVDMLSSIRKRLTARLRLSADRTATAFAIDGRPFGQLPYDGDVPIGTHRLDVTTADGRFSASQEATFQARQSHEVRLHLVANAPPPEERPTRVAELEPQRVPEAALPEPPQPARRSPAPMIVTSSFLGLGLVAGLGGTFLARSIHAGLKALPPGSAEIDPQIAQGQLVQGGALVGWIVSAISGAVLLYLLTLRAEPPSR